MAPELLRQDSQDGTKKGDIYSFAIITSEVINEGMAYDHLNREESVEELIYKVKRGGANPFRPVLNADNLVKIDTKFLQLIYDCWSEYPEVRPSIDSVCKQMDKYNFSSNMMDHLMKVIAAHTANLEEEVERSTHALREEQQRSDLLLFRMMPKQIAEKLKAGQKVEPEAYSNVTVLFSDIVRFASIARRCTPLQVINLINRLFSDLDNIIEKRKVYKVETVGDGYLCVSGLPIRNGNKHVTDIADMAFDFMNLVKNYSIPGLPKDKIHLRIGINTGPCTAGVVGLAMPRYCLFGDTINTASRMETSSKSNYIHITAETNRFLTEVFDGYITESRGEIIVKGKGVMETFWLLGKVEGQEPTK